MTGDEPPENRRGLLVALAFLVLLALLGGLWVSGALRHASSVQDCAMQGRSNCTASP